MELRQLRYFVGVAEAGSLLKASARLHVAQPALGQQMTTLEEEVGARLFDRSSRGVALTEAGRLFLDHARVVLADVERAREAVRDLAAVPGGNVVVGLPTTVALVAAVPIVAACRERLPRVRLKLVEGYSGFLQEWLQQGRLDFALIFGDSAQPGLAKQPLLDEPLALVTPPTHPPRKRVKLQALAGMPLVLPGREHGLRRIIDEAAEAAGVQLDVVAEIDSLGQVKRAVEAGLGSTILTPGSVAEDVVAGRLRSAVVASPGMERRIVCATSMARPATAAAEAVMDVVVELIRQRVLEGSWPGRWIGRRRG